MENVGIFNDHLEYFMVYFSRFGMFVPRKIWQLRNGPFWALAFADVMSLFKNGLCFCHKHVRL
jgi:hypothetical protein